MLNICISDGIKHFRWKTAACRWPTDFIHSIFLLLYYYSQVGSQQTEKNNIFFPEMDEKLSMLRVWNVKPRKWNSSIGAYATLRLVESMQATRVFITMEIYETYNQSITSTHYEMCHDSSMCNVRSLRYEWWPISSTTATAYTLHTQHIHTEYKYTK